MQKTIDFLNDRNIKFDIVDDRIIINRNLYLCDTTIDKDIFKNTTINGCLSLKSLTSVHKDFLKGITINSNLYLDGLTSVHKDFLSGATINGYLFLDFLTSVDKDFLKNTTIKGSLSLDGLTSVHKDFLKGTTINGKLYFYSLTSVDKDFLKDTTINGKLYFYKLKKGNNIIKNFDGIWNIVYSTHNQGDYIIHNVNGGYVIKKNNTYAHGKTIKTAIRDLEFKISDRNVDNIRNLDIHQQRTHDELYLIYRLVTGACSQGIEMFINNNDISNIKTIKDVIDITTELNSYGYKRFKEFYKEC